MATIVWCVIGAAVSLYVHWRVTVVKQRRRTAAVKRAAVTFTDAAMDAATCKRCGHRSDWHSADLAECPDDDCPHPYSLAAGDDDDA